ncbi:hypothetical protein [Dyadobacter sp. CY323]|uniref:alpha/beta hydrolase n=1 Tax=Dyadobacter sp. CY323 TaxID=2907302 RepID=UPI001F1C44D6|nr:hypothetical protein [Dyadobacter sp. CY323]MCE6988137.1 hypothetical protein [Dyadobacter sp. CY323]
MLKYITRTGSKENLILFIHGFAGSEATWLTKKGKPKKLIKYIFKDNDIKKHCDAALYIYDTNFFPSRPTGFRRLLAAALNVKSDLSIDKVSDVLATNISVNLADYENIIFIAHSMGGVISKSCIIKLINAAESARIKLFCSLAVPHNGLDLASLANLLHDKNIQIQELRPLSEMINSLNRQWLVLTEKLPPTIYYVGHNDQVVQAESSVAYDVRKLTIINTEHTHNSIVTPTSKDDTIVISIVSEIKKTIVASLDKSEVNKINDSLQALKEAGVEFTVIGNFEKFNRELQLQFLEMIASKLQIDKKLIIMRSVKPGSVKITLDIPEGKLEELFALVADGEFKDLGVQSIRVLKESLLGRDEVFSGGINPAIINRRAKVGDTVNVHYLNRENQSPSKSVPWLVVRKSFDVHKKNSILHLRAGSKNISHLKKVVLNSEVIVEVVKASEPISVNPRFSKSKRGGLTRNDFGSQSSSVKHNDPKKDQDDH